MLGAFVFTPERGVWTVLFRVWSQDRHDRAGVGGDVDLGVFAELREGGVRHRRADSVATGAEVTGLSDRKLPYTCDYWQPPARTYPRLMTGALHAVNGKGRPGSAPLRAENPVHAAVRAGLDDQGVAGPG